MQLEDLKVGEEYYTANDHAWATGQLGGRMRLMSVKPVVAYAGRQGPVMHCVQLNPATGRVLDFRWGGAEVFLECFRGTWAEVGAPVHHAFYEAEQLAEALNAAYRRDLEIAAEVFGNVGVPARVVSTGPDGIYHHLEITPTFAAPVFTRVVPKE